MEVIQHEYDGLRQLADPVQDATDHLLINSGSRHELREVVLRWDGP
jgi:hypothetical protein